MCGKHSLQLFSFIQLQYTFIYLFIDSYQGVCDEITDGSNIIKEETFDFASTVSPRRQQMYLQSEHKQTRQLHQQVSKSHAVNSLVISAVAYKVHHHHAISPDSLHFHFYRSRGATTSSKLGVQFLGLGYYYPSTEKNTHVYPVWCSRLHNHTVFIKKLCKKLRGPSKFWGGPDPRPLVVAPMYRRHLFFFHCL